MAKLLRRYADGENPTKLAEEFKMGRGTLLDIARRKIWKHIPCDFEDALALARAHNMRFAKKHYVSDDVVKEAVRRRKAGESYKDIAAEIGVCAETLKRSVRRLAAGG